MDATQPKKRGRPPNTKLAPIVEHKPQLVNPAVNQVIKRQPTPDPIPEVEKLVAAFDDKSMTAYDVQEWISGHLNIVNEVIRRTKQFEWHIGGLQAIRGDMVRMIKGRKETMFGRAI